MGPSIEYFKKKRVLITGGGGYLGSKLAEKLTGTNSKIFLVDVKFNPIAVYLSENYPNVQLLTADLTQKDQVIEICSKIIPDLIFHFAAFLNRSRDFSLYDLLYEVNVKGTLNLLEAIKKIPYKGFYFASSSEVYGSKNNPPFTENQIPSPVSPYSLSKLMAEQLIQTFSDIENKPYTILRIFNFYGQGMSKDFFINQLIDTLKSNQEFKMTAGEQVRDFLFIDDLLDAIIFICGSSKNERDIFNICSGKGIKLKEIAQQIAKQLDKTSLLSIGSLPYRENEIWNMYGSNSKLINLGFSIKNQSILF
ncbi:MAG TPA: NAD-dependent epimerase/dehydratase family protein [Ignavibacteriaceae bacterium]|nr:NAD-dependent epimerase/dehydratase family protein [Ignavibacteriaceae bacterium]